MLAPLDPAPARPDRVPARRAGQGDDARGGGVPPASRSPTRRESQEACFLAGDDYRAVPRPPRARGRARGRSWTRTVSSSAATTGYWRYTPGQRRGIGVAAATPALRDPHRRRDEHRHRRAASVARLHERRRSGPPARADRPRRGEAALSLARAAGDVTPRPGRLPARARRARLRRRVRPGRRAVRRRRRRRLRCGLYREPRLGSRACRSLPPARATLRTTPSRSSSWRPAPGLAYVFLNLGATFAPPFLVYSRNGARVAAGDPQARRERRQGEPAAGQGGSGDGQRSGHGRQRRHGRTGREHGDRAAGREGRPASPRASRTVSRRSADTRDWNESVRLGKEAAARRERDLEEELRSGGR